MKQVNFNTKRKSSETILRNKKKNYQNKKTQLQKVTKLIET